MTEKVKLPQAVAEAITSMRDSEISDFGIVAFVSRWNGAEPDGAKVIRDWSFQNDSAGKLLSALVNGYEIEPKYKVGDWVVIEKCNNGDHVGNIQKLINISSDTYDFERFWYYKKNVELRHAIPEEIKFEKERQLWKLMDRKVGEFKIGDIRILDDGNSVRITDVDYARAKYNQGSLKGFFPAESFISFEEVESNA